MHVCWCWCGTAPQHHRGRGYLCRPKDKLDLMVALGWSAVGPVLVPLLSNTAHLPTPNLTAPEHCTCVMGTGILTKTSTALSWPGPTPLCSPTPKSHSQWSQTHSDPLSSKLTAFCLSTLPPESKLWHCSIV